MTQAIAVYYAPDIDNAWSVAPGALADINMFAPLQQGHYGSMASANYFTSSTLTGSDIVSAYMFRKVDGTVRFFVNRATNIDEYDSSATRTNRATGLTSSTDWAMCAQGNAVIACSSASATQVSTGAGFSALGGGSLKAAHCASNFGFVMLANTDTSADQVWWSALYNYASFTPSIATEAGNQRLLEAPGPITALASFRDGFVAFKDNALFVGEYTGPNYIWRWRMISNRVGCVGGKAVTELDGKLYFLHTSGFYEFDGQTINSIGTAVNQTFLLASGFSAGFYDGAVSFSSARGIAYTQAAADDIEGVVWFNAPYTKSGGVSTGSQLFGYNPRSRKWGRAGNTAFGGQLTTGASITSTFGYLVNATTADVQAFKADKTGRIWMVWNDSGGSTMQSLRYPIATSFPNDASSIAAFKTGLFGSDDGSARVTQIHHRTMPGTTVDNSISVLVTGYSNENKLVTNGTSTGAVNTEFDVADVNISSRYRNISYQWSYGAKTILAGLAPVFKPGGAR